jgi:hypothetical protein
MSTASTPSGPVDTSVRSVESGEPVEPVEPGRAPAAPKSRYSMGTMPNMLRSLLVIGFFVLVLVAIVPRMSQVERPSVDAGGKAAAVATQTGWPVEMPTGLGSDWVPTTATYAVGTLSVPTFTTVWRTPSGHDLSFKQAKGPTQTWLTTSVTDNPTAGTASVGGRTFERYAGGRTSQVSYVVRPSASGGLTLVATTDGSEDELKAFVAGLEPVTPSAS